jgi:hypothetical protein
MVRSRDLIEVDIERDRGSVHNRKFYCEGNPMGKLLLDNISGIAGEMIKLLIRNCLANVYNKKKMSNVELRMSNVEV